MNMHHALNQHTVSKHLHTDEQPCDEKIRQTFSRTPTAQAFKKKGKKENKIYFS